MKKIIILKEGTMGTKLLIILLFLLFGKAEVKESVCFNLVYSDYLEFQNIDDYFMELKEIETENLYGIRFFRIKARHKKLLEFTYVTKVMRKDVSYLNFDVNMFLNINNPIDDYSKMEQELERVGFSLKDKKGHGDFYLAFDGIRYFRISGFKYTEFKEFYYYVLKDEISYNANNRIFENETDKDYFLISAMGFDAIDLKYYYEKSITQNLYRDPKSNFLKDKIMQY